jgi:hypothetical protein
MVEREFGRFSQRHLTNPVADHHGFVSNFSRSAIQLRRGRTIDGNGIERAGESVVVGN